jgi:hypothetical protein
LGLWVNSIWSRRRQGRVFGRGRARGRLSTRCCVEQKNGHAHPHLCGKVLQLHVPQGLIEVRIGNGHGPRNPVHQHARAVILLTRSHINQQARSEGHPWSSWQRSRRGGPTLARYTFMVREACVSVSPIQGSMSSAGVSSRTTSTSDRMPSASTGKYLHAGVGGRAVARQVRCQRGDGRHTAEQIGRAATKGLFSSEGMQWH